MHTQKINGIGFITGRWPLNKNLPTIIFIHGSGGTNLLWKEQVEQLSGHMNAIAIDLPGHGESDGEGMDQIEDYAEIVTKFVKSLDIDPPAVCGLSIGGAIALQLILSDPDIYKAGIIVNSGARLKVLPLIFEAIEKDYEGFINSLYVMGVSEKTDPSILKPLLGDMATCPAPVTKGDFEACNSFDIMNQLHKIKKPVLVLSASEDKMTPTKYGKFLADELENSQIVIIEDAGHLSPVEKPDEVSLAIKNFMLSL